MRVPRKPMCRQVHTRRRVPLLLSCPSCFGRKNNRPSQLVAFGAASVCTWQRQSASAAGGQRRCQWPGGSCVAPCSTRGSAHARVGKRSGRRKHYGVLSKDCLIDTPSAPARLRARPDPRLHSGHFHCTSAALSTPASRHLGDSLPQPVVLRFGRHRDGTVPIPTPAEIAAIQPHPMHDHGELPGYRDRGSFDPAALRDAQAPGA